MWYFVCALVGFCVYLVVRARLKTRFRLYRIGDADTVVAKSTADACVWHEFTGEDAPSEEHDIVPIDDNAELGIWCNVDGSIAEPRRGARVVRLTAAQWARREGRGFLCSTEF